MDMPVIYRPQRERLYSTYTNTVTSLYDIPKLYIKQIRTKIKVSLFKTPLYAA